jgi:hypothetical protein
MSNVAAVEEVKYGYGRLSRTTLFFEGFMKTEPQDDLRELILKGEQTIVSGFDKERRLNLIELARAMDYNFVGRNFNPEWGESNAVEEHASMLAFGLHKALKLSLDESSKYQGAPLFRSTPALQMWANATLVFCGQLGYCEHLLELHRVGLVEIGKIGSDKYSARLISTPYGVESYERENFAWTRNIIATMDQEYANALSVNSESIKKMMFARVDAWRTHYIQYRTSPKIDAYYQRLGLLQARMMIGNDTFPRDIKFGGQEFGLYCAAVTILVGWSMKHLGFCFELLKKRPSLEPQNIVTITSELEDVVESLSAALDVDSPVARQLIDALTLTLENKEEHCSIPGNLITPMFIEIGENKLLRPVWGSLSEPFLFLLRELRYRYRMDWDDAVNMREQAFRKDLYSLFLSDRFYKLHRSVILKNDGERVTDVDAFILDCNTGEAALFQLKWQDFIGNSMRERESKKKNLLREGNQWIERVSLWLSKTDRKDLAQTFNINPQDAAKISSIRLFMIGRNFAHFSGDWPIDKRAAWGMWHQLCRLISNLPNFEDPIASLYYALQDDSPVKKLPPEMSPEEIRIGDITITINS